MGPDIFTKRHKGQKVAVEDTGDSKTAQPVDKARVVEHWDPYDGGGHTESANCGSGGPAQMSFI